jgi:hypothetical protein
LAAAVSLAVVAGLLVGTPAAAVAGAAAQAARPVVPLASPQSSDVPGLATGHPGAVLASPLPVTPDTPPVHVSGSAPAAGGFVPGGSVENVAARTATMKVFDNPDGSHTAQISTLPQHFRDVAHGSVWSDIDSSVVADGSRSGWYRSGANAWTARFGPTPVVEFDSAAGGVQTLTPVGGAAVAPVLGPDPDEVTYPGVWANVDLRYRVGPTGVEEDIVVKGPTGRSSFDFATGATSYASTADGGMVPSEGAGAGAAVLTAPVVRDANGVPVEGAGPVLSAVTSAGVPAVRVSVDSGWTPAGLSVCDRPELLGRQLQPDVVQVGWVQLSGVRAGGGQLAVGGGHLLAGGGVLRLLLAAG